MKTTIVKTSVYLGVEEEAGRMIHLYIETNLGVIKTLLITDAINSSFFVDELEVDLDDSAKWKGSKEIPFEKIKERNPQFCLTRPKL